MESEDVGDVNRGQAPVPCGVASKLGVSLPISLTQQTKANLYSDQRQPKVTSRFYVWKWIFKRSRVLSKFRI